MSNATTHSLYPINEVEELTENDPLLMNNKTGEPSITFCKTTRPALFRYTDRIDPTRTHTIIEVKSVPSGMYWVTDEGCEFEGETDNSAYQYYKMETEFVECYNNIFTTNTCVDVGNTRIDCHKQQRALAYIQNKSLNRIESHLDCMRVLYIFWSLVSVAMIIAGIVLAVRHDMF